MSGLFVEPSVLHELHDALINIADDVGRLNPAMPLFAVAAAMPGSDVALAAVTPEQLVDAVGTVGGRIRELGFIASGSQLNYVATEEEVASAFANLGEF